MPDPSASVQVAPVQIARARAVMLLRTIPASATTNLAATVIGVILLWQFEPKALLLTWAAVMAALQLARLAQWRLLSKHPDPPDPALRLAALRLGAALTGIVWGMIPALMFPEPALPRAMVIVLCAGIASAAVSSLTFDGVSAWTMVLATIVPLLLRLLVHSTPGELLITVMAVMYLGYLALVIRRGQHQFRQLLQWQAEAHAASEEHAVQARRIHRQAQFSTLLARVNQLGSAIDSPEALYVAVCHAAVEAAPLRRAGVAAVRQDGTVRWLAKADPGGSRTTDGLTEDDDACVRDAWFRDEALLPPRTATSDMPPVRRCPPHTAALPIHMQGGITAVLLVAWDPALGTDTATLAAVMQLAANLQSGLQGIWQRERIANLQRLYRALMGEGEVVLQARSADEMLLRTCEKLTLETRFNAAWVVRPDASGRMRVLASAGDGKAYLDALAITIHDENQAPPSLRVWDTGVMVCCNNLLGDDSLEPWHAELIAHGWRSALAMPVQRGGSLWGVIVCISPQSGAFDQQTTELCERIAALLGHGLDELDIKERLAELQREDAHRARHDVLTGLPNRYALSLHLPKAIARAQRNGTLLGVGMIDLDGFKPVNDTWGHEAGDRLLRELTQRLRCQIRQADLLVRLGGDEFVVVIEDGGATQSEAHLHQALHRLQDAVAEPFALGSDRTTHIRMSMGLALYPRDATDADTLLRQADRSMYAAKMRKRGPPEPGREQLHLLDGT